MANLLTFVLIQLRKGHGKNYTKVQTTPGLPFLALSSIMPIIICTKFQINQVIVTFIFWGVGCRPLERKIRFFSVPRDAKLKAILIIKFKVKLYSVRALQR